MSKVNKRRKRAEAKAFPLLHAHRMEVAEAERLERLRAYAQVQGNGLLSPEDRVKLGV